MRTGRRRFVAACFLFAAGAARARAVSSDAPAPARVRFDYHSGFLLNLHHLLYHAARHPTAALPWVRPLTPSERADVEAAVALYRAGYAKRDLLFDADMLRLRFVLAADDARSGTAGLALPPDLARALELAAPVYQQLLWPADDAQNRRWIAAVRALDQRYGAEIQAGVERLLRHAYPAAVRVDVVARSGTMEGAYTADEPPASVIPSGRDDYAGLAALEMLYHESAHVHVTDTVEQAIAHALPPGRDPEALWHALQFETVGSVTAEVLQRRAGLAYTPYAVRNDLFANGGWQRYRTPIDRYWQPYLHGTREFGSAIAALAAALAQ